MNWIMTVNKNIFIRNSIPILSLLLLIIGGIINNYFILFLSVMCLYIYLFIYCLFDWKKNLILLAFLLTFFLFLLGNPTLTIILGKQFKKIYTIENINFAFYCIYSALLGLYLYKFFYDFRNITYKKSNDLISLNFNYSFIKKVVIIPMLFLSGISSTLLGVEQIIFIQTHTYTDYYSLFSSQLPTIIRMFVQFWLISVCFFLATKPKLKIAIPILILNLILNIPTFIVGMRSPLMISLAFTTLYICLRFIQQNIKFNKKLIIIGICLIPILTVGLSIYGFSRNGEVNEDTLESPITSFILDQGHMFDIIADSKSLLPELPDNRPINYVIGPVYDTIVNNPITRALFKLPSIGNQNEIAVKYSHNMKIQLSYLFFGDKFYSGQGVGTSYILETYVSWGFLGVILWSMLISFFCSYANWSLNYKSKFICNGIILLILSQFLYTPRANALLPFVQVNHIVAYIILLIFAQLIKNMIAKKKGIVNGYKTK